MDKYTGYKINLIKKEKVGDAYPEITPDKYNESLCKIAKEILQKENEIGFGGSADVYRDPVRGNNLCYKFINRQEPLDHEPEDEAAFMMELDGIHPIVRVPEPLATMKIRKVLENGKIVTVKVLVMEKIDGYTLQEVCDNPNLLPDTYNHEEFFKNLKSFILEMHTKNIHHRDLHSKNIMIESKTGYPVVIDFGRSTRVYTSEENPYVQDCLVPDKYDGRLKNETKILKPDLEFLNKNELEMSKFAKVDKKVVI